MGIVSHVEPFEPGAWVNNPDKRCPHCRAMAVFAMDIKKWGPHQVRVCVPCGAVYLDGKLIESLRFPRDDA